MMIYEGLPGAVSGRSAKDKIAASETSGGASRIIHGKPRLSSGRRRPGQLGLRSQRQTQASFAAQGSAIAGVAAGPAHPPVQRFAPHAMRRRSATGRVCQVTRCSGEGADSWSPSLPSRRLFRLRTWTSRHPDLSQVQQARRSPPLGNSLNDFDEGVMVGHQPQSHAPVTPASEFANGSVKCPIPIRAIEIDKLVNFIWSSAISCCVRSCRHRPRFRSR